MKTKAIKLNMHLFIFYLAVLPIVSIILMFSSLKYGIMLIFGSFLLNTIIYYRNKSMLENELFSVSYVAAIIHAAKSLASVNHPEFTSICKGIQRKGTTY